MGIATEAALTKSAAKSVAKTVVTSTLLKAAFDGKAQKNGMKPVFSSNPNNNKSIEDFTVDWGAGIAGDAIPTMFTDALKKELNSNLKAIVQSQGWRSPLLAPVKLAIKTVEHKATQTVMNTLTNMLT